MTKRRKILSALSLLAVTFLYLLFQYKSVQLSRSNPRTINILYWTPMFGQLDFNLGLGSQIFQNCSYSNCFATFEKKHLASHGDFDAILFHAIEYNEQTFGRPKNRTEKQIYVFSNQESPVYTPHFARNNLDNFFNWTMTYRLDSDIVRPYGFIKKIKNVKYKKPRIKEIRAKKKLMAWFVSNCATSSKRERLFQKIAARLPVDLYGSCGNLTCLKENAEECYSLIENKYKFYLSFENSLCNDYATEKLYNILKLNIIPVVFGGGNYAKLAPPKSVINIKNFKSLEKFVDYITFLDTHPEEYLEYFEWKKNYIVDTSSEEVLCNLCRKLNENKDTKVYKDIVQWWHGEDSKQCFYNSIQTFFN